MAKELRAIPILLLICLLVFASFACAGMVSVRAISAHPCCPKSGRPAPDHCAKMGCASTVPALRPASITNAIESPVATLTDSPPLPEDSFLEQTTAAGIPSAQFEVFLRIHQFLI